MGVQHDLDLAVDEGVGEEDEIPGVGQDRRRVGPGDFDEGSLLQQFSPRRHDFGQSVDEAVLHVQDLECKSSQYSNLREIFSLN